MAWIQRIERLWRDVFENCLLLYYNIFYFLEDNGVLELDSDIQLFCLQYVYVPRIQKSLDDFRIAWNHHTLTSAGSYSPLQLWTLGMFHNQGYSVVDETFLPSNGAGTVDASDSEPHTDSDISNNFPNMHAVINPLDDSNIHGIDLYAAALEFCND